MLPGCFLSLSSDLKLLGLYTPRFLVLPPLDLILLVIRVIVQNIRSLTLGEKNHVIFFIHYGKVISN